jgi:cell wall-associated NlpC family hydrolase
MKRACVYRRVLAVLVAASFLAVPAGRADPEPTPHRKKHPADDSATPTPSPSRAKHHRTHPTGDDGGEPSASPAGGTAAKPGDDGDASAKTAPAPKPDEGPGVTPAPQPAATSTIDPSELRDFDAQPEPIRNLLNSALDLTRRNLTYTYGSSDPASGGMDCSGTIYYLLKTAGFEDVPRSASGQYCWVRQQSRFYAVLSKKEDSFELKEMRPGDLLFWTGTYHVDHDPPVTHTMLYLGRRKKDGKPLMVGASDGRPYDGEKRNGVSVFDFRLPAAKSADPAYATTAAAPDHAPDFAGYGPIPGMAERNDAASRQAAAAHASQR